MNVALLPSNRTLHEECLGVATDPFTAIDAEAEAWRGLKYARPLEATVAPWLVREYGLGPIAGFFATVEDLIDLGRAWQKVRGTPSALTTALGWIGYDAISLEDQVTGRRRWHLYQIDMGELPTAATEDQQLADAEYLADLSDPARSEFFRGFHGYDVRTMRLGSSTWGNAIWGDASGVRINGGSTKWSHGRSHTLAGLVDPSVYTTLGIDFSNGDQVNWNTPGISWNTPGVTWNGITDADAARAWYLEQRPMHIRLEDGGASILGYARVFEVKDITGSPGYDDGGRYLQLGAVVPFGASPGDDVATAYVVLGGEANAGVKPAKQWYLDGELAFPSGELELFSQALSIDLMKTCRERITAVMEI